MRARRMQLQRVEGDVAQVDRHHLQAAGLEPGEVEHIVEQRGQVVQALALQADDLLLAGIQGRGAQQLDAAQDAADRRADLVAHVRQEAGLHPRGGERFVARGFQIPHRTHELDAQVAAQLERKGHVDAEHHQGTDDGGDVLLARHLALRRKIGQVEPGDRSRRERYHDHQRHAQRQPGTHGAGQHPRERQDHQPPDRGRLEPALKPHHHGEDHGQAGHQPRNAQRRIAGAPYQEREKDGHEHDGRLGPSQRRRPEHDEPAAVEDAGKHAEGGREPEQAPLHAPLQQHVGAGSRVCAVAQGRRRRGHVQKGEPGSQGKEAKCPKASAQLSAGGRSCPGAGLLRNRNDFLCSGPPACRRGLRKNIVASQQHVFRVYKSQAT